MKVWSERRIHYNFKFKSEYVYLCLTFIIAFWKFDMLGIVLSFKQTEFLPGHFLNFSRTNTSFSIPKTWEQFVPDARTKLTQLDPSISETVA